MANSSELYSIFPKAENETENPSVLSLILRFF